MALVQEANFLVTLSINGIPVDGNWDSFEGGEVSAEASNYRPGGMREIAALVGPATTSEITLTRGYRVGRDERVERTLVESIGYPATVGRDVLDHKGDTIAGTSTVYDGVITRVATPRFDSMGNAVTRLSVSILVSGLPKSA